jgi:CRISPR system Cascade subunit CasE
MRLFANVPKEMERMLFRCDCRDGSTTVLIQSRTKPDFAALPQGYCTDMKCRDDYAEKLNTLQVGQQLRFRLTANPTRKVWIPQPNGEKHPTRSPLHLPDQQEKWLRRKMTDGGADVITFSIERQTTRRNTKRGEKANQKEQIHVPVLFEGVLMIKNRVSFLHLVEGGIGSAKGYGFGLLSLAPA